MQKSKFLLLLILITFSLSAQYDAQQPRLIVEINNQTMKVQDTLHIYANCSLNVEFHIVNPSDSLHLNIDAFGPYGETGTIKDSGFIIFPHLQDTVAPYRINLELDSGNNILSYYRILVFINKPLSIIKVIPTNPIRNQARSPNIFYDISGRQYSFNRNNDISQIVIKKENNIKRNGRQYQIILKVR